MSKRVNKMEIIFRTPEAIKKENFKWRKIEPEKSSDWIKMTVKKCHELIKEQNNPKDIRPLDIFTFRFKIKKQEYKAEIIIHAVKEIRIENNLINWDLETETSVFKKI